MVVELFTKRKIVDVKDTDNRFDREYSTRLYGVSNGKQLSDFLRDYEEFLPEGLQRFRDANAAAVKELIFQKNRIFEYAKKGKMLAEPTEAAALYAPPMITYPRMLAIEMVQDELKRGRRIRITWGQAFKELANGGLIQKLMRTQERMYRKTIPIEEIIENTGTAAMLDLKSMPEE